MIPKGSISAEQWSWKKSDDCIVKNNKEIKNLEKIRKTCKHEFYSASATLTAFGPRSPSTTSKTTESSS